MITTNGAGRGRTVRSNQCALAFSQKMPEVASALCWQFATRRHWLPKREGYPHAGRTAEWQVAQRALLTGSPKWHRGRSELALRSGAGRCNRCAERCNRCAGGCNQCPQRHADARKGNTNSIGKHLRVSKWTSAAGVLQQQMHVSGRCASAEDALQWRESASAAGNREALCAGK